MKGRSHIIAFALTVFGPSCDSQVLCPCPSGGADLVLPTEAQGKVVKVTATPCSVATSDSMTDVFVQSSGATTCDVRVTLTSGETLTSTITFRNVGGCCPYTYFEVDASTLMSVDGGS
jgi:hypothetical protein